MKRIIKFFLRYKIFVLVNLLVLLAKIIYSYKNGFEGLTFEDWNIANNLAKFNVYSEFINLGSTAYKLPLYPILLSFFIRVFGDGAITAVIIFQHFIYFFIPIIFISISKIFDKKIVGILTDYLFVFSPAYFFYSNTLEITNVFIIIFLNFLYWFLIIWKNGSSTKRILLLSISSTLLFFTQVIAVPIALILLFSLLVFRKLNIKQFAIVIGTTCLLYSPWVIRNYLVFDKVIISKTPVWQNIHFGYFSDVQIFKSLEKVSPEKGEKIKRNRSKIDEFRMEEFYKKDVLKFQKEDRFIAVKKAFANVLMLWYVPSRYFYDNSISILVGRKLYVIVLNVISLLALLKICKQKDWFLLIFSLLLFVNFTIPYMIGHAAMTRFKLDFEWYQLFLVAYFIFLTFFRNDKTTEVKEPDTNFQY